MFNWLLDVDLPQTLPAVIHVDNSPAKSLAWYTKGHAQAKHINIQHHYICEHIKKGDIDVLYIPSTENPANLFIKLLPHPCYEYLVRLLHLKPQL